MMASSVDPFALHVNWLGSLMQFMSDVLPTGTEVADFSKAPLAAII